MKTQIIKSMGVAIALGLACGANLTARPEGGVVVAQAATTPQARITPGDAVGSRPLPTGAGGTQDTPAKTGLGNTEGKGGMGGATTGPGTGIEGGTKRD